MSSYQVCIGPQDCEELFFLSHAAASLNVKLMDSLSSLFYMLHFNFDCDDFNCSPKIPRFPLNEKNHENFQKYFLAWMANISRSRENWRRFCGTKASCNLWWLYNKSRTHKVTSLTRLTDKSIHFYVQLSGMYRPPGLWRTFFFISCSGFFKCKTNGFTLFLILHVTF